MIFQRLITVGEQREDDILSLFKYISAVIHLLLLESSFLPLQANKAALADALWKAMKGEQREPTVDVQNILNGGALLHIAKRFEL